MDRWRDVRAYWDRGVRVTEERAREVVVALLAIAAVRAFQLVVAGWQIALIHGARSGAFVQPSLEISDRLAVGGTASMFAVAGIAGVLFLRWLARAIGVARALSPRPIRWSSTAAVSAFFLPVVSLVVPYLVIRDLHDQLDPEGVPEPAPRPRLDGALGYRDVPQEKAPPPPALPHASIGAWWALFIAQQILAWHGDHAHTAATIQVTLAKDVASDVLAIAAALLAVRVIRAVQGRLSERSRRLRHASDAELEAWGIAA